VRGGGEVAEFRSNARRAIIARRPSFSASLRARCAAGAYLGMRVEANAMRLGSIVVGTVMASLVAASLASSAETGPEPWKKASPGTPAFLGDDGGGVNTATVCDTADRYRDWLSGQHPPGCQTFQHDLPVVIEVVTYDPVRDRRADVGLPIAKIHIPSQNFVGYLQLLMLHPVVPSGTVVRFRKTGNETIALYPSAAIDDEKGIDLGSQVSASVVSYDPSKDDEFDLHVTILDGDHKGQTGWMLAFGGDGEDGVPIEQFSRAVLSERR
jgi:hypothetical protein